MKWGCTCGGVYVPCIYTRAKWNEAAPVVEFMYPVFTHVLNEHEAAPVVEFMYPVFTRRAKWNEAAPVVEFMYPVCTHVLNEMTLYLWWSLCTLYLHTC